MDANIEQLSIIADGWLHKNTPMLEKFLPEELENVDIV